MAAPLESSQNSNMEQSYQSLTVRNSRGELMIQSALNAGRLELGPNATGKGSHEKFAMATVSSDNIVQQMIGGEMKTQGMPRFFGEIMASVMTTIGPKGVSFARYSIDYHVLRNYFHNFRLLIYLCIFTKYLSVCKNIFYEFKMNRFTCIFDKFG